ncbi:hypothetical protein SVIOM342S_10102 [Streptomyces violaceorubidus]
MPSPARSSRVKIMPASPRAERLCSIWRASVDFPQSIVPEKNTSSGMRGWAPFGGGGACGGSGAYFEQRDELLGRVIEPWLPTIADSLGSRSEAMSSTSSRAAATTSPMRPWTRSSTRGPNQPAAIASSREATQNCSPSTSRQQVSTSLWAPGTA